MTSTHHLSVGSLNAPCHIFSLASLVVPLTRHPAGSVIVIGGIYNIVEYNYHRLTAYSSCYIDVNTELVAL